MPTYLLLDASSINALIIITLLFETGLNKAFCDRSSVGQKAEASAIDCALYNSCIT
ncbi:MAG: hypothetical protein V7K19_16460 [Nostoc sp.]